MPKSYQSWTGGALEGVADLFGAHRPLIDQLRLFPRIRSLGLDHLGSLGVVLAVHPQYERWRVLNHFEQLLDSSSVLRRMWREGQTLVCLLGNSDSSRRGSTAVPFLDLLISQIHYSAADIVCICPF